MISFLTGLRMCSTLPYFRGGYLRLLPKRVLKGHRCNGGASPRPQVSQHCGCCHQWCPHTHGPKRYTIHCASQRIQATKQEDIAQKCVQHRLRTPLTIEVSSELSKKDNWDYRSRVAIAALWAIQGLVLGGPRNWTPARTVERCAAWYSS